jgi:endonuclease/exonuclease/phosphatase family metal-dependent hydrolase
MNNNKIIVIILGILLGINIQAQSLKVMTYNIRLDVASDGENAWPFRKDFFASQINFYEPDVLGVQEAMPHQVVDLEKLLSQYSQVGIGREGAGKGESSNIFYKKNKFKVIKTNTFWLSETPEEISKGWDAACHRVCTYGLFQELTTNRLFWVFNTHLDHIGVQARTKGLELILSKINQLNTKKYPVILMGDFNSEPQEARIIALKEVMDDTRQVSIEKPFGPSGTFNNFEFDKPVKELIDYVFISKKSNLKVKKYAILSDSKNLKYPSDHLPVYVEILFPTKPQK